MDKNFERKVWSPEFYREIIKLNVFHIDSVVSLSGLCFSNAMKREDVGYFLTQSYGVNFGVGGKKLFAYFLGLKCGDDLEIISVGTHPEFRRRGLSSQLLREAIEHTNPVKVFLEVNSKNEAAILFYHQFGFKYYGLRKNYYGNEDAELMVFYH